MATTAALLAGAAAGLPTPVFSGEGHRNGKPMQALFDRREDAERAAPSFGCTGAHRMGNQWMPCAAHSEHTGME
ncbi:DUF3721 domain-containing protein [Synechococcus sp. RSCCF101]|uniref:DUF3721 domain-containing protein n=1 Tax=Synechococcus sp. RSCCF101 TaxID=2511069 RepID=UPI001CD951EE|nr:DUF3721 domain-containing protein [Synechococcus sp. RSCCF101]